MTRGPQREDPAAGNCQQLRLVAWFDVAQEFKRYRDFDAPGPGSGGESGGLRRGRPLRAANIVPDTVRARLAQGQDEAGCGLAGGRGQVRYNRERDPASLSGSH